MSVKKRTWQKGRTFGLVLFFAFFLPLAGKAEPTPMKRWALGLGSGWISDYPGSAQGRVRFLPFPVYRGSIFRIDRISGVSGEVYNNSRLDFSWNFIFQFPTDSNDIPVREGMPDLDWLLSLGPQVKYYLYRSQNHKTYLRMPVRLNSCTNFGDRTRFCGVTINPGIRHALWLPDLGELTFRAEALTYSSEYQQYYFEVQPQYATATRQAFHARAGFLGFVYGFFHSLPFDGWSFSSAFNVYDYSLAINDESPLFVHKTNYSIFFAVTLDLF